MQAVVTVDGELRWTERPDPVAGDTELLVAVRAAGVNGADVLQRRGGYPAPSGVPADVPGLELAGDVIAVGRQVTRFAPGDRVMGLVGGGGQATRVVLDETHAIAVPPDLTWPEAGGFPEVFATAWDALWSQASLAPGERLLVTGAAGGVGTAAVQLGDRIGARVVASTRDPAMAPRLRDLGAEAVVTPDEVADHGPYDVVLELVGAPSLETALPSLATGARVVVIGVGAGGRLELNLLVLMGKRARIGGSTLRARDRTAKAQVTASLVAHVLPWLAAGQVRVPVAATFPMAEAETAYDRFTAGGKFGKIVLVG
jgi:NADPH:quinone reductase